MDGGNANTWSNYTYMKVACQLQKNCSMCMLFLIVQTQLYVTTTMQVLKKSNIIDYMSKYNAYKLHV